MLSLICKNVQHVKIYLPCDFEVNPITHFGVIDPSHRGCVGGRIGTMFLLPRCTSPLKGGNPGV